MEEQVRGGRGIARAGGCAGRFYARKILDLDAYPN